MHIIELFSGNSYLRFVNIIAASTF